MMVPEEQNGPVIDLQIATADDNVPSEGEFRIWVHAALPPDQRGSEVTIRLVGEEESKGLNGQYRDKPYATNVLSFPSDLPQELDIPYLGDLVICVPVVEREAREQSKPLNAHWAHMVVHGTLHLLGYDHQSDEEADAMEAQEAEVLALFGFTNPYGPQGADSAP